MATNREEYDALLKDDPDLIYRQDTGELIHDSNQHLEGMGRQGGVLLQLRDPNQGIPEIDVDALFFSIHPKI